MGTTLIAIILLFLGDFVTCQKYSSRKSYRIDWGAPSLVRRASKVHASCAGQTTKPITLKCNGEEQIITSPGFPEPYSKDGQ